MNITQELPTAVIDAFEWRYATKKFDKDKKLQPEVLEQLLEALRLAPSSMGLQPYRFIHVKDPDTRRKLREVSFDQAQITDASELIVITAKKQYTADDIDAFLSVSKATRGYTEDEIAKRKESIAKHVGKFDADELLQWNSRQAYIALGQVLSAAAILQVDACPMEGIKAKDYAEILGLNELGLEAFAVVTLGYRSHDDALASQAKIRLPKEVLFIAR